MIEICSPHHQVNLQGQDYRVRTVIGQDESQSIAVSEVAESHAPKLVVIFVDSPIEGEPLA